MAKIKYIAPSPKAGQISHERPDVARTLIAAGFAEAVPYKSYVERLREEGQPAPDPNAGKVEWGVLDRNTQFREVTVVKKFMSETTYFSAPPPDAPDSIKRRFAELSDSPNVSAVNAAEFEKAKNAQIELNHKLADVRRY